MQTTPTPKLETSSNATTTSSASNSGTYSPKPSSASYSSNGGNYYPITPCDINIDNIGGGSSSMDSSLAQYFSPYIKDLQHRIKLNWNPPKDCNANKVVCLIKIGRDGRLLSSRVYKSSGYKSADMAALRAIEITAPFRQFPANFKEQSIDIQFTFDYIVRR
jgi:TonB family protein